MDHFWADFVSRVDVWALMTILILIGANILSGLVCALKFGMFQLKETANFLRERIIPYVGGYLVMVIVAAIPLSVDASYADWFKALPIASFAFIVVTLIGKLFEQWRSLGLPIPDIPILEAGKTRT